ncbi:serine hydrolase domain-containing protein [Brevibacterium aurantiacum]|uniref:Class A beta-lactamase-related serine hydrolase n=1 Tax=Brevibacterium aurantiacum TaxID=273384 RepID=A0A4Z0KM61_BREAU|nr:serine hydrolase [Brevibacterium aurantiacum]TGD38799.1 class A beta-lactamase-related serine hydrolase [Brevibacterium aurantiacum]
MESSRFDRLEFAGGPSMIARRWRLAPLIGGFIVLLIVGAPTVALAEEQPQTPADLSDVETLIDEMVPRQLEDGDIPGAVVTVVADGKTVYSQGYGDADPKTGEPMDAQSTGIYTASEAKLLTATAAFQLVESGKLDLDTDINDYLDSVDIPNTYPGQPITLRDLLTYTSGFDYDVYGWSQWSEDELPTLEEFAVKTLPPRVRPPGELIAYNNFDFVLTGRLIEIASGQDYADYIEEHVSGPAGMSHTSVGQPHPNGAAALLTPGYRPSGDGQEQTGAQLSPASPAGPDVVTTGADMGRFMTAMLSEDSPLGTDVLKTMQQQQFTVDPRMPGMGFAFEHRPMNGQKVVTKDGDQPGTHHNLALLPEHDIGIHVAYNGDGTNQAAFWGGKELVRSIVDQQFPSHENAAKENTAEASAKEPASSADKSGFEGIYRPARASKTTFTKVGTLTSPITVESASPGKLTTVGLSENPDVSEQTWVQTSAGQFRSPDGEATLAFTDSGDMVTSQMPNNSFSPVPWYQSPFLHLIMLGAAAAVLLAAFVFLPVRAIVGRARSREEPGPTGARIAKVLAWAAGLCFTAFGVGFVLVSSDANQLAELPFTGSPTLSIALNTMSVMGAITVAMVVFTVLAWIKRWWGIWWRLIYSLVTISAIVIVTIAVYYRLIGVPLTITV